MIGRSVEYCTGHQTAAGSSVYQSFRDAEEQRVAVVQAAGNERLD